MSGNVKQPSKASVAGDRSTCAASTIGSPQRFKQAKKSGRGKNVKSLCPVLKKTLSLTHYCPLRKGAKGGRSNVLDVRKPRSKRNGTSSSRPTRRATKHQSTTNASNVALSVNK